MSTNKYFQNGLGLGVATEQDLAEQTIIEQIQLSGFDMFYIPKKDFNIDEFFREDPNASYEDHFVIEMWMKEPFSFGGQGDMFSKFGLEFNQQIDLLVSRSRFLDETEKVQPDEGDLIYFPLPKILFQIDLVEDEPLDNFYSLSKLYTIGIKCSIYQHGHEDFDSGILEVDEDLADLELQDRDFDRHEVINNEANDIVDITEENIFGTPIEDDIE